MLTHVVLTGLILIEATKTDGRITGLTAYVLKTDGVTTSWGQSYHPPTKENPQALGHHAMWVGNGVGGDLTSDVFLSAPGSGFAIDGQAILDLGQTYRDRIYSADVFKNHEGSRDHPFKIKAACKQPRPMGDCLDSSGKEILAARIHFSGAWRVQGLEIGESHFGSYGVENNTTFGLVLVQEKTAPMSVPGTLHFRSGVLVSSIEGDASMAIGQAPQDLGEKTRRSDCFTHAGDSSECELVHIVNHLRMSDKPAKPFADTFHWHTDAFYELLENAPTHRLMTYTLAEDPAYLDRLFPSGGGTGSGRPCPPTSGLNLQ